MGFRRGIAAALRLGGAAFLLAGWLGTGAEAQIRATVSSILQLPDQYHAREVEVQGKVARLNHKVAKSGKEYTTFTLLEEGRKGVRVFMWGKLDLQAGQQVTVIGTFNKEKKVGHYLFTNEIEASVVQVVAGG